MGRRGPKYHLSSAEDGIGRTVLTPLVWPRRFCHCECFPEVSPSHPHPTPYAESPMSSETSPEFPVCLLAGLYVSCHYSSFIIFIIFAFLFRLISFTPYKFHHLFSIFLLLLMIRNQNQTQ